MTDVHVMRVNALYIKSMEVLLSCVGHLLCYRSASHLSCSRLQDVCPDVVHIVYLIKPEKFWEKHKTNVGSSKYAFEVSMSSLADIDIMRKS